jgi:hypothetical protein
MRAAISVDQEKLRASISVGQKEIKGFEENP